MPMQIPNIDPAVLQAARNTVDDGYEVVQIRLDESGAVGVLALPLLDLLDLGFDENPRVVVDSWSSRINAWCVCFESVKNADIPYASAVVRLDESGGVNSCGVLFGPMEAERVEYLKNMSRIWASDESRRLVHSLALAIDNIGLLSWTDMDAGSGYRAMLVDPLPGPINSSEDTLYNIIRQIQEWIGQTVVRGGPEVRSGRQLDKEELLRMISQIVSEVMLPISSEFQIFVREEIRREVAGLQRISSIEHYASMDSNVNPLNPNPVMSLVVSKVDNLVSLSQRVEYAIAASLNDAVRFASDRVISIISEASDAVTNADD